MIDIKELASKCGVKESYINEYLSQELSFTFSKEQLQAFAEEYAALVSSEPVGYIWNNEPSGELVFSNLDQIRPANNRSVYLANTFTTQLQTEIDECIAYIKKLEAYFDSPIKPQVVDEWINFGAFTAWKKQCAKNALSYRPASLEQLLGGK